MIRSVCPFIVDGGGYLVLFLHHQFHHQYIQEWKEVGLLLLHGEFDGLSEVVSVTMELCQFAQSM